LRGRSNNISLFTFSVKSLAVPRVTSCSASSYFSTLVKSEQFPTVVTLVYLFSLWYRNNLYGINAAIR